MLTPTNSFLLLGDFMFVPILVKIGQEMRQTDRYTDIRTDANQTTICAMLYAIGLAMGQVIKSNIRY